MQGEHDQKPVLHLICGLPGAGKTTLAKEIEAALGAVRFCPDKWIKEIWPPETVDTEGNGRRDQVEQLQWKMGKRVLQAGADIVIEWGTWGRDERLKLRDEAWAVGARVKFYLLDAPHETLKERILRRNERLCPDEFLMPAASLDADLRRYRGQMQFPQADELRSYDELGEAAFPEEDEVSRAFEFRRVTPADEKRWRPLVDAYWLEIMPQADTVRTPAARDAYFARRFPSGADEPRVFWGLDAGEPIGFVSLSVDGKTAKVNDFYVVPSRRRQGLGARLVEAVRETTDGMGIERLDLNVRRDNPAALKFWESQGFMIGHYELTQYRDPAKRIGFLGALSSDFAD